MDKQRLMNFVTDVLLARETSDELRREAFELMELLRPGLEQEQEEQEVTMVFDAGPCKVEVSRGIANEVRSMSDSGRRIAAIQKLRSEFVLSIGEASILLDSIMVSDW